MEYDPTWGYETKSNASGLMVYECKRVGDADGFFFTVQVLSMFKFLCYLGFF